MRKWKILLVVLGILAVSAGVLAKDQLNRRVILLKNGRVIPVDRVWEAGTDLFYENEREIHFVSQSDIKAIERQSLAQVFANAGSSAAVILDGCRQGLEPLLQAASRLPTRVLGHGWLAALPALVPVAYFCGVRLVRRRREKKPEPNAGPAPREAAPAELPKRADVVRFFLNLYRHQLGAGPEVPAEFAQLPSHCPGANQIYELRVKSGGDWVKRRMTIGPLGEDSGSKSKCYYVIFDQHLVLKIPPKPIRDFEDYVASIKKEGRIVERLAPKECIVPRVSVILGQMHRLPAAADAPPDVAEEKYISWLRKNPVYQEHLKIKGTFVFFMDLSRYYFLSHIIDGFHDLAGAIRAEIQATADLIRYPAKFKERFGEVDEAVGFEIRDLFHQCEAELRARLKRLGQSAAATPYRIQTWFLNYLEKQRIEEADTEVPAELVAAITAVFEQLFNRYRSSTAAYLSAVRSFAARLCLSQNRQVMSGIVTNLLELLASLDESQVAMRDLKPDNLLVAGDPQHYPAFLRSAADYSLGFIDVETAVYFGKAGKDPVRQPLLGGTPYYATPSHLFPNATLAECFGDTPRTLHLQDWHAVLVMIFKVVTGELLFDRTAKLFVEIKSRVIKAMREGAALEGEFEEASRSFWRSAAEEFRCKMRARENALRQVEAEIPKNARFLLLQVLRRDIAALTRTIQRLVETQTCFPAPEAREQLLRASHSRLCQMTEDCRTRATAAKAPSEAIRAAVSLLKHLSALKGLAERKAQMAATLEGGIRRLSAYELLVLMFNSVLKGMYRDDWKAYTDEQASLACPSDDELSLATTI